jgi:SWI/SNF-related matrix-associated actin-dependent regulator of chromatin subfamily A3
MAIYHGSNRNGLSAELRSHDVVLTTYDTLRSEWTSKAGGGVLYSEIWARVVLDEGKFTPPAQALELCGF